MLFDKLNFMKRLENAGASTRPQAKVLSEALHQAISESVATKQDLGEVRHEVAELRTESMSGFLEARTALKAGLSEGRTKLHAALVSVRSELGELRTESRSGLAEVRHEMRDGIADMKSSVSEMNVWSVSVGATIVAVLAALKYFD